ncbi:MAG TPA: hypothetical protein VHZ97_19770 [Pseudonocardiaceae bacterium]|jgi:hypothetical protein|nr:hypothetical protein [Pseudonocardiaceae bacterium]
MIKRTILGIAIAAIVLTGCSSTPPPSTPAAPVINKSGWNSTQLGLVAATGDPATMPGTPGIGKGIIYLSRVYVDQNTDAGIALTAVITPGTGLIDSYLGVYDPDTGKLLASTGDISSQFETAGTLRAKFTTPLPAQTVNKELWLAVVIGGMTKPPAVVGDREYGTNLNLTSDFRLWVSSRNNYTSLPTTVPAKKEAESSSIPFLAISP